MIKYLLWGLAWILSQQFLALIGIIAPVGIFTSIVDAIISIIAVRFARNHEWLLGIICVVFIIWFIGTFVQGEFIGALVSLFLNSVLLILAFSKKNRE